MVSGIFFDLTIAFGASKYIVPFISWPTSHSIEADYKSDVRRSAGKSEPKAKGTVNIYYYFF